MLDEQSSPTADPAPPVADPAPPVADPAPPVADPAPPVADPAPPVADRADRADRAYRPATGAQIKTFLKAADYGMPDLYTATESEIEAFVASQE